MFSLVSRLIVKEIFTLYVDLLWYSSCVLFSHPASCVTPVCPIISNPFVYLSLCAHLCLCQIVMFFMCHRSQFPSILIFMFCLYVFDLFFLILLQHSCREKTKSIYSLQNFVSVQSSKASVSWFDKIRSSKLMPPLTAKTPPKKYHMVMSAERRHINQANYA